MVENRKFGWIECICGSMFSGKSEELLRRIKRGVIAKQNVLLFKPSIDNRYDENKVSTHNGNSYESVSIDSAEQIYDYVKDKKYDIIGIDEIQFFDNKIVSVINKKVFINNKEHYINKAIEIFVHSIFDALNEKDISQIKFYRNEL